MQNVRDPLCLAFLDAVPLGMVAGGGRNEPKGEGQCVGRARWALRTGSGPTESN